jgi:hypothetical protein
MTKIKITPLSIVLIALEVMLVFFAFYYLVIENNNGMALGGVIALIASLLNALLIAVQQIIADIKGINKKTLWTIEILIIAAGTIYVAINGISIG